VIQDDIIRLIVIEETVNDAEVILNSLRKARYPIRPRHVEDEDDLQEALAEQEWDLLISIPQVGEFTVAEACEMVELSKQDIPVIVLVDKLDGKSMTEHLKVGARQVIPSGNDVCLQIAVGRQLDNLNERRQRKRLEQLYRESQRHNKTLLKTSRDAIAYVIDGMHIYANPSYLEMFGFKNMEELEGLPVMDLVSIDDQAKLKEFMREFTTDDKEEERQIDLEGLKSNNKRFKLKMEVCQAIYDTERCIQVIIRDEQTQSQELEQKIREINRRDQLTGLFNRQHFNNLLEKALAKAIESHLRSIVLYIALDNVNEMRESIGIGNTDPILKNIGQTLQKVTQSTTLARFTDSAFTLLITDKDIKYATELAEKICKAVESCITEIDKQSIITTCSIGIATVLASTTNPQEVLTDAHTACVVANKRGGNTYEIYKAVVKAGDQTTKTSDIAKLIETANEEKRLSLRFQPIVSLHGETQEIYEVYLRMVDSKGENIPANQLFSAAEQANLSTYLDKWVLKNACAKLAEQEQNQHQTHLFIKLSDQAVRDETILLFIRKVLKENKISGERLIIEMSESIAISQVKLAQAFIKSLKAINCKSALEHFGTGLNSEATLKHIPVDYIKIDSSYSKGLASNTENQEAVRKIVKMAHEMNKLTIAEAVEDANSLTILWQSEIDFAQGHYIQEPSEEMAYDFTEE